MSRWPLVILATLSLSCDDPIHPTDHDLRVGETMYLCRWVTRPPTSETIVDLVFPRPEYSADLLGPPTSQEVNAVTAKGGIVVYRYNLPALRARIATDSIAALDEQGITSRALTVPDSSRYDIRVLIQYASAPTDSSRAVIVTNGGRITGAMISRMQLFAEVPDRAIPAIRTDPKVLWVGPEPAACGGI